MSTTAQYITHTFTATVSVQVPRTITADTDPQTVEHALHAFYRRAHDEMQYTGGVFPFATLRLVAEVLTDGGAITCEYTNEEGVTRARTLFPSAIHLTEARKVEVRAYDTFRQTTRSFRLDRMAGVHVVTLPNEAAA
jgi:predicted DNA-binding transcriptional regulator YafY